MLATINHTNISNVSHIKQLKKARFVKSLLFLIALVLHVGLIFFLLRSSMSVPSKQPVFMEIQMLSVPAPTTTSVVKTPLLPKPSVKKESVKPPLMLKKPTMVVKKTAVIISPEPKPISPLATEQMPVAKSESTSVTQEATATPSNAEVVDKLSGKGQEAERNAIVSGIVPLVKVGPIYPNRAASRGIEGWVRVEFTIRPDGSVADAVVVQAQPEAVFDDAALDAINQWQFKPKMVNGVAVPQRAGQQLQFKLDH